MPAPDALVRHAEFRQELDGGVYENFIREMVPSLLNPDVGAPIIPATWDHHRVLSDLRTWADAARTYYVAPDMMRLAIGAMEQLPDDAEVRKESPMSPQGFLWMPEPLRIMDVRGRLLAVNAILWSAFGDGVTVWLLADKYDPLNDAFQRAQGFDNDEMRTMPRLTPWHGMSIIFGKPLPTTLMLQGQKPIPPDVPVEVRQSPTGDIAWAIGDDGMVAEDMHPVAKPAHEAQFLTVLWRLMRQTVVSVREEEVGKRARRLAEKHLNPKRHVTVIELRKHEYHGKGDRTWSLDHRVLVQGHWRWQWYGSGEDRWGDYIYIHPYVKGPDGAPLVMTDTVIGLLR